jgi:hypothetical protein
MPKAKRKAVAKMKEKVEPTYYATLTEDQFDELNRLISWDNPINQLYDISGSGEISQLELGFKLGELYSSFQVMFEKCKQILESIEPESQVEEEDDEEEDDEFEW